MIKKVMGAVSVGSLLAPILAFAQTSAVTSIDSVIGPNGILLKWFGYATVIIIALAVVYFLVGILKFIMSGSEAEKRGEAIGMIVAGVVAIFVMISVWGLVGILTGTFGLAGTTPPAVPRLPTN